MSVHLISYDPREERHAWCTGKASTDGGGWTSSPVVFDHSGETGSKLCVECLMVLSWLRANELIQSQGLSWGDPRLEQARAAVFGVIQKPEEPASE